MICREQMDNPNQDDSYSITGGRNDANPSWCDCRQGECKLDQHADEGPTGIAAHRSARFS